MSTSKLLIVNPNSTVAMTDALKPLVSSLPLYGIQVDYFTAPPPSPTSINDKETSRLSAEVCLPHLLPKLADYDAFLIACYSEHPLVPQLRDAISNFSPKFPPQSKFVMGIFESSVMHALSLVDTQGGDSTGQTRWGIVTTGKVWEELLGNGTRRLLGVKGTEGGRFAGVSSTGLNATELHDLPKEEVVRKMKEATKMLLEDKEGRGRVTVVCLGCAGMVGLNDTVRQAASEVGYKEGELCVVDGVQAGVLMLKGLVEGYKSRS